jgi:hypothetical protein
MELDPDPDQIDLIQIRNKLGVEIKSKKSKNTVE